MLQRIPQLVSFGLVSDGPEGKHIPCQQHPFVDAPALVLLLQLLPSLVCRIPLANVFLQPIEHLDECFLPPEFKVETMSSAVVNHELS